MNIPLLKVLKTLYPDRFLTRAAGRLRTPRSARRVILWVVFLFIVAKLVFLLFYYNQFLSMQYDVEEAWAQIDTQMQRRKNIILNLHTMVTDYALYERDLMEGAAESRKEMVGAEGSKEKEAGDQPAPGSSLEALLGRIFAVAERYPDLRLSESFQRFMDALVDAETKVAEQRMIYNVRANIMSTAVGKFPGLLFAKIYGFDAPDFFSPEEDAHLPPRVEPLRQPE